MRNLVGIGLLLLLSVAYSARLPLDLAGISSKNSQNDELEEQLLDQTSDSEQSMDDQDESSPIESRYEVRDSESSEETTDYDNALEEILEDIVDMLQTHPELLKELMNKNPTDSNRPEEGREVIDDNYPHTDASEESRELDEYLTKIQERAHDGPISDIQGDGQDNRIINIQEGGQDDPMFDFERLQEPEKQNIGDTNRVDKDETISEERQEHLSRTTADDISDSEQNKKIAEQLPNLDSKESKTDQTSSDNTEKLVNPRSPKYRVTV